MSERMVRYELNGLSGIMPWLDFSGLLYRGGVCWHPSGILWQQGAGVVGKWHWAR